MILLVRAERLEARSRNSLEMVMLFAVQADRTYGAYKRSEFHVIGSISVAFAFLFEMVNATDAAING